MLSTTPRKFFLLKSQMISCLKLKHVVITSHHIVLSFKHHSTDLITLEFWPTAPPSTLLTTSMYNDTHTSYFLCWLQPREQSSLPSCSISNLKPSTVSFTMSFRHPIFFFNPLTYSHHSTKPQNHNFH